MIRVDGLTPDEIFLLIKAEKVKELARDIQIECYKHTREGMIDAERWN